MIGNEHARALWSLSLGLKPQCSAVCVVIFTLVQVNQAKTSIEEPNDKGTL